MYYGRSAPSLTEHEEYGGPLSEEGASSVPQGWLSHVQCHRTSPTRGSISMSHDLYAERRATMVATQIAARGVTDPAVLAAMRTVPREAFVPPELAELAYDDMPLPIGEGQTISQPYIVALMTAALRPSPTDRVLEIGTGSGGCCRGPA